MLRMRHWWAPMSLLWAAAGCKDTFTDARLPQCSTAVGTSLSLAVGAYAVLNGDANAGCVILPANTSGTDAEYLLVGMYGTGEAGAVMSYLLQGGLDRPVTAAPAASPVLASDLPAPERFHLRLRQLEAERWAGFPPPPPAPSAGPAAVPPLQQGPKPVVGDLRSFQVLANTSTGRFERVGARARAVGGRLAIFVDTIAPIDALTVSDLDELVAAFDNRLYAADTAAFGRESDINGDSVVIVLMTPVVNRLVTTAECQTEGYVVGFFAGSDIDPLFANDLQRSNRAEVFYALVPDPAGTMSCAHSQAQVKRVVAVAFVHEFQHMISYNQHVLLRGGSPEALWLNEALSHYAEELGGRTYLDEGDDFTFTRYVIGNLYNATQFLNNPGAYFVLPLTGIGGLAERGAGWLFVRHLVDQYSGGTTPVQWNVLTRRLVQTVNTGATNVQAVIGVPFSQALARWGLGVWVDDLPVAGFTAPPELQYASWNFRDMFQQLNGSDPVNFPQVFPLAPVVGPGDQIERVGVFRAGTPIYQRAVQAAGAASFTLRFGTGYSTVFPASAVVRLGIVRIR